jgi:maltooligosyltrehalose trehalohydrolase
LADNVTAHHETTTPPAAAPDEQTPPVPFGISLGARLLEGDRCEFRVWAPGRDRIEVHITAPHDRRVALKKNEAGYHEAVADPCPEHTRYFFDLGDQERPDPASRSQPDGVHAASEVIGREFAWTDRGWKGIPIEEYVIY